ncbi:apolipoprotein(a)-like [Ptychodera flava]|uniref:apolipoprotein(a)-like n=1 Tax=Ptychodera flava TaxID=63121 RepID=UPI003969FD45
MIAILLTTLFIVVDFSESASECYHAVDGYDYRGTVSTTVSGYTCQEWTEQSPHSHTRTPENYPNAGLGEHNYCRNPDGTSGAWCYTTDSSVRWELCDIGQPDENCVPASECYHESDGNDYRGTVSMTVNGNTCQEWTEQSPHSHSRTPENYPDAGLGEHNYCRNPDDTSGAWCYTTDSSVRWELCDIGQPEENCQAANECYHAIDAYDYRGTVSRTENGRTCQEWTEQSPHSHTRTPENYPNAGLGEHNYCRNPDGTSGAWCYTTDPNNRWELCDVGQPDENCVSASECYHESDGNDYRGTVSRTENGRTCQEWTEQSPHSHTRTPENYPNAGLGEHNYCRNPDDTSGAWCYTRDSSVRWELCDIGQPEENCEPANECYHETDGNDYRGTVSRTENGRTCQEWTDQSPHSHTRTPENYPNSGLGQHNYCRNPDGTSGAWCYTTDPYSRWELCDIGQPYENCGPPNECYHETDGSDYRGTVSMTVNGRTCQEWTEQSPQSHSRTPENYPNAGLGEHNYCRNPDGWSGVWCYTTDASVRWEACDIGQPDEHCVVTSAPVTKAPPPTPEAPVVPPHIPTQPRNNTYSNTAPL